MLREALTSYKYAVLYADPQLWQDELAELMDEFSSRKFQLVVQVPTASAVRFAPMCERLATAIEEGHVTHDGESVLLEALSACVRRGRDFGPSVARHLPICTQDAVQNAPDRRSTSRVGAHTSAPSACAAAT